MNFIASFFQEPAIIFGIISLVGLIILKKSCFDIIKGTFETIIGFIVFSIGSEVISSALNILGPAFQSAFHMQGVIATNEAVIGLVQKKFGVEMALIMAFGFAVNIIIARFTSLKYVFLTGHHVLFMSGLLTAVLAASGFKSFELIIVGALFLGTTMVISPAVVQPFYRKVTGSDNIAMGHYNALSYVMAAEVSKITGNKEHSTEDIKVPEWLNFFKNNVISTAIVMSILFLVTIFAADPKVSLKLANGENLFMFSIMGAFKFTAGFVIILQGIRMMLAEIVPAFKGIAEKFVPKLIPALDCPVIFPFSPNAVIVGFLSSLAGAVIMFLIFPETGLAVIIPGLIPAFFVGGAAGVLANAQGGLRGTIIGCFINGFIITLIPALLLPYLGSLGLANSTFGDADFAASGIVLGCAAKLFSKAGVYGLLVVIFAVFALVTIKSKKQ